MKNMRLEEWKVASREAMHFNDLLMRNRQIGFSVVLALLWGATQAFSGSINISLRIWEIISVIMIFLFGFYEAIPFSFKKNQRFKRIVNIKTIIFILILLVIIFYFSWNRALINVLFVRIKITGSIIIVSNAILFLFGMFLIDMFYYYQLLLGAVERLSAIEAELGFKLTDHISGKISAKKATHYLYAMYISVFFGTVSFLAALLVGKIIK